MYFQATMLMTISPKYLALFSKIQKDMKDRTTNLAELVLQIIRHFMFMEDIKKNKSVFQTSTFKLVLAAPIKSCKNPEYMEEG